MLQEARYHSGSNLRFWIHSTKSGSGMGKYAAHFVLNFFFRPLGMLALQESRLVPPHRPIKPVRRPPALLRRHAPKYCDLLWTRFFIRQHGQNVRREFESGKLIFPGCFTLTAGSCTAAERVGSLPDPLLHKGVEEREKTRSDSAVHIPTAGGFVALEG